jgi:glycosyltransferase involved in cell wall biosynthesis
VRSLLALRRADVDLIHAHWLLAGIVAALAGKPFVLTLHGSGSAGRLADLELARRAPRLVGWIVRRARIVIAVSQPLADAARSCGAHDVRVIPNGIAIPEAAGEEVDPSEVLYAGRLSPEKGVEELVAATAGLPLVVVGDGPEWRRLKRLAGPTVRLVGRLSDSDVADVLRSAQALVVTAEEEFGIAAVESLASGRPVIALRSGGVLETVTAGRTGCFYDDADDPGALAAAVLAFDPRAVDPGDCVEAAERFGVERFQNRLRAIVGDVLTRGRSSRPPERSAGGLLPRRSSRRGAESMRIR